jgi:hypothetical protein
MPIPGRRKAWKWLVGLVLVAVYGLTASPASFAQDEEEGCKEYAIECPKDNPQCECPKDNKECQPSDNLSKCGIPETPEDADIRVTLTVERTFVDCAFDILPPALHASGQPRHSAMLKDCALVNERWKVFRVDVAQVELQTVRLNTCDGWPACLNDLAAFDAFQASGLAPREGSLRDCHSHSDRHCAALEFRFDEEQLFMLACGTSRPSVRKLAVIGELQPDAKAIARDGRKSVDVGGAFVRGLDTVVCLPKGPQVWPHR